MEEKHVLDVYEVESLSFSYPWSIASLKRELTHEFSHYYVALLGDEVVGYCGLWMILDEGHITNIAVHPSYRRQGIGQLLMDHLLKVANENNLSGLTLEVRLSNFAAQTLYSKNGFVIEGIRKNYYVDTKEDALVMWRYMDREGGE